MPRRVTASRYTRAPSVNQPAYICQSKYQTLCYITYTLCGDDTPQLPITQRGISLNDCRAIAAGLHPSHGNMHWADQNYQFDVDEPWNDCPVVPIEHGPYFAHQWSGFVWQNPSGAQFHDAFFTNHPLGAGGQTTVFTAFDFQVDIDDAATIVGIKWQMWNFVSATLSVVTDLTVFIQSGGGNIGGDLSTGAAWPGVNTLREWGGDSDTLGIMPTPTMVKATNFGFAISAQRAATPPPAPISANIDAIILWVYTS